MKNIPKDEDVQKTLQDEGFSDEGEDVLHLSVYADEDEHEHTKTIGFSSSISSQKNSHNKMNIQTKSENDFEIVFLSILFFFQQIHVSVLKKISTLFLMDVFLQSTRLMRQLCFLWIFFGFELRFQWFS